MTTIEPGAIKRIHDQQPMVIQGDGVVLEENALVIANMPDVVRTPLGAIERIKGLATHRCCPSCKADTPLPALVLETLYVGECSACNQFVWYRPIGKEWPWLE